MHVGPVAEHRLSDAIPVVPGLFVPISRPDHAAGTGAINPAGRLDRILTARLPAVLSPDRSASSWKMRRRIPDSGQHAGVENAAANSGGSGWPKRPAIRNASAGAIVVS